MKRSTKTTKSSAELELDFQTAQLNYRSALRNRNYAECEIFLKQAINILEHAIGIAMGWAHEARERLAAVQQLRQITRRAHSKKQSSKQTCVKTAAASN